ncbi:MAG TPA: ester cyclase [Flavitalea sp.]|nr:ester cyclase [Flavitalea sp.]
MEQVKKNKEFVIDYFNAISGVTKSRDLLGKYVTDQSLVEHILFFDAVFPMYELFIDEMMGEGNKVNVRARVKGVHGGDFNGIPPTGKQVEIQFVVMYEIENKKIIHHWLIADQLALMEQLGIMNEPAAV